MSVLAAVNDAFNDPRLRKLLLTLRLPLGIVAGAAVVWFTRREWFWPGVAVSAFGALFQWWCFGCILTSKTLALKGPYMLMRNPMYVARFFLVLGLVLMTGAWWLAVACAVLYYFYMVNRVKREEVKLREIFGAPYEEYCRDVPRFLPGFKRFEARSLPFFSLECFRRNHGFGNMLAVAAVYALLAWRVFGCCCR